MLTIDTIREIVPKSMRSTITQELVDKIEAVSGDSEIATLFKENLLTYTAILKEGKFSFDEYINACRYVTYKAIGSTNREAYVKIFPERFQHMKRKNMPDKDINSIISAFGQGKLVKSILERSFMPIHILFRDMHMEVLAEQFSMMYNASSETVRQKAGATVLEYTKGPEESRMEIDMSLKTENDILKQYENALNFAAKEQLKIIEQGGSLEQVANIPLTIKKNTDEEIIDINEEAK